jgi:hypothetical protein
LALFEVLEPCVQDFFDAAQFGAPEVAHTLHVQDEQAESDGVEEDGSGGKRSGQISLCPSRGINSGSMGTR